VNHVKFQGCKVEPTNIGTGRVVSLKGYHPQNPTGWEMSFLFRRWDVSVPCRVRKPVNILWVFLLVKQDENVGNCCHLGGSLEGSYSGCHAKNI